MILEIIDPRSLQLVTFDLAEVVKTEQRVHEISFLTSGKAPELFSSFVRACFSLGEIYSKLVTLHRFAERKMAERRAIVMLEEVPKQLDKKGSNAEMREAVLDSDVLYQACANNEILIEGAMVYCKLKLHAMEEALNAAKRVLSEQLPFQYRANPNLSAPSSWNPHDSGTEEVEITATPSDGIQWVKPDGTPLSQDISTTMKIGKTRY
jgi:hypothetical protein